MTGTFLDYLSPAAYLGRDPNAGLIFLCIMIGVSVLIAAVVAFYIVYYFIYKRKINKALAEGKPIKSHMPSPGSTLLTIGVIIWVVSTIFIIFQLQMIMLYTGMLSFNVAIIGEQTDSIYNNIGIQFWDNVNKEAEKQSLVLEKDFKAGKIDAKNKTAELTISITPRILPGKDDKFTFRIGDSQTELKPDSAGRYSGTVTIGIFTDPTGILTFEGNGEKISEIIADAPHYPVDQDESEHFDVSWESVFPSAESREFNTQITPDGNGKSNVSSELGVYSIGAEADESYKFSGIELIIECDDKELRRVDILKDSAVYLDDGCYKYKLDEVVDGTEPKIMYRIEAKDELGYSYVYNYKMLGEDGNNTAYEMYSVITAKDGSTITFDHDYDPILKPAAH